MNKKKKEPKKKSYSNNNKSILTLLKSCPKNGVHHITFVANVEHGVGVLMNSLGQKVYSGPFSNEDVIDVSNLPRGIYCIEITDKDKGKKKMRRIMIQ